MIDLIQINGNSFQMGDFHGDYLKTSIPVHKVSISDFKISKYPVTQQLYELICKSNPSNNKDNKSPVEMVSWFDCIHFCNELSKTMGYTPCYEYQGDVVVCRFENSGFRLPTEAEWEYAATDAELRSQTIYSGSNSLDMVGWYKNNSNNKTHRVGEKEPNKVKLHDMSGNVWEWCWDWFGPYTNEEQSNPFGPENGTEKVYRGGSFLDFAYGCTVTVRGKRKPNLRQIDIGFRVVKY